MIVAASHSLELVSTVSLWKRRCYRTVCLYRKYPCVHQPGSLLLSVLSASSSTCVWEARGGGGRKPESGQWLTKHTNKSQIPFKQPQYYVVILLWRNIILIINVQWRTIVKRYFWGCILTWLQRSSDFLTIMIDLMSLIYFPHNWSAFIALEDRGLLQRHKSGVLAWIQCISLHAVLYTL